MTEEYAAKLEMWAKQREERAKEKAARYAAYLKQQEEWAKQREEKAKVKAAKEAAKDRAKREQQMCMKMDQRAWKCVLQDWLKDGWITAEQYAESTRPLNLNLLIARKKYTRDDVERKLLYLIPNTYRCPNCNRVTYIDHWFLQADGTVLCKACDEEDV